MPVRSLDSSVRKWPDPDEVLAKTKKWASELLESNPRVLRVGVFGSYGRGEAGVGSDLDLILVVDCDERPFHHRLVGKPEKLPLPADVLVFTQDEWEDMHERGGRFADTLQQDIQWLAGNELR